MRVVPVNNYFGSMLRYFELGGRSSRREYWWYSLGSLVALCGAFWIDYELLGYWRPDRVFGPVLLFATFVHIVPGLTLTVRRLHDSGKSGWWYWIALIPLIGGLWLFYLTAIKGPEYEAQKYGPDPRDPGAFEPTPMRLERHQPLTRAQLMVQQMEERRRRMA
jgi:uncharacterized membrane protein YhaH (DUF805 family)